MWLTMCPEKTAGLRQGDFLHGLVLTRLVWPLSFARQPEAVISKGQTVLLPTVQPYGYLVVSQCCTIENQVVAALAEVKRTPRLSVRELEDYEREEPLVVPEGAGGDTLANTDFGYVFNAHVLAPFGEYLPRVDGRAYMADLSTIQTYSGRIQDFQESRVAAMTPVGRRALRIRLSLFWGRVEAEDENFLAEHGIPAGLTPPVVAAEFQTSEHDGQLSEVDSCTSGQDEALRSDISVNEHLEVTPTEEEVAPPPAAGS